MNLFKNEKGKKLYPLFAEQSGRFVVSDIVGSAFTIAYSYNNKRNKFLLITPSLYKGQQLYSLLSSLVDPKKVSLFPSDELLRAELIAENNELSSQRIYALYQLVNDEIDILICPVSSLLRYLPEIELFKEGIINININDTVNIKHLSALLVRNGYRRVNKIDQSMQFAIRGDIIDIFSLNYDYPLRIELFDDTVESIRLFNIATQTSFEKRESATILVASDLLLNEEEKESAIKYLKENLDKEVVSLNMDEGMTLREKVEDIINDLCLSVYGPKLYKYYSTFKKKKCNIIDYCKDFKQIFIDFSSIKHNASMLEYESNEYLLECKERHEIIGDLSYYHRFESLDINDATYYENLMTDEKDKVCDIHVVNDVVFKDKEALDVIDNYLKDGYDIKILLSTNEKYILLKELLDKSNIDYVCNDGFEISNKIRVNLSIYSFPYGVVLKDIKTVILTEKELFKTPSKYVRYSSRYKEGTIIKSYEELEKGDYVVHEYQGIGIFDCLETIEVDGVNKDYMKILSLAPEVL